MAYTYQTPETVKRSAEEYLALGKDSNAFDLLVNYMSGKKPRQWSPDMEKIMTMIIDLSFEFDKKGVLREPFNNYRFATQNSNMASFENVLLYFANAAEEKNKAILNMAKGKQLEIEDLENEDPAELFINALQADTTTEKTLTRNALKLVWDTYKIILEIVCRNRKLEELYGQIAKRAFDFCKVYGRRAEFKRLSESFRNTLSSIIKSMTINPDYYKIPNAVDLTNVDTNDKQMSIRFEMLEYAYHFEQWQESLKILEDIHTIMMKRRAAIKPQILSGYFENLAKMFWKSEFYLYHAVAYFNHFTLIRTKQKNISAKDLEQKTSAFVLSVLCIPPLLNENLQSEDAKFRAIALLSSESTVPSKQELITYIAKHNLLDVCPNEVRELYYLVEDSKNMVNLTKNSEPLLNYIQSTHGDFKKPLQNVIIYKLLGLLSKLYTKLKIESFSRFLGSLDYSFCEKIIHTASNAEHIKVRIDHKRRLLIFQDDVEDMQSLSLKFVNFSEDLKEVIYSIDNTREEGKEQKVVEELRDNARRYTESATGALQRRLKLIEALKRPLAREAEARPARQAAEERVVRAEVAPKGDTKEAEEKKKRNDRLQANLYAYEKAKKESLIKKLKGLKGFKIDKKKVDDLTEDEIAQIPLTRLEQLEEEWEAKEKEKEEAAIKNAFKRADYYERAKREEHIAIIKSNWAQKTEDKEEIAKVHKENFNKMVEFKKRIGQAAEFRSNHTQKIMAERTDVYEEKLGEFRERVIEDFKDKILAQARESLKAQKEAEEEEKKKRDAEFQAQKQRLEEERSKQAITQQAEGLKRNAVTSADMQRRQEETKKDERGGLFRSAGEEKKPAPVAGGFTRGTGIARKEEEKPSGLSRNTETTTTTEAQKPRFVNAKKEGGEEKKNPFGDARPTQQAPVTQPVQQAAPVEEGGWRTANTAPKKKEDAPKSFGFSRGTTSGAASGTAPSKGFGRNTDSNASGGAGSGWRK